MFRTKICGITCLEDALAAVNAGVDAIGLNFYGKSARCITPDLAREICATIPASVKRIGVFVNENEATIRATAASCQLDAVQLHGNEPPDFLPHFHGLTVIVARRLRAGAQELAQYVEACVALGTLPQMLLIDAYKLGEFGGTGETVDWQTFRELHTVANGIPLVLAGGLTPQNVQEAIDTAQPHAVDTASAVEISPGRKCPAKMSAFVASALHAFDLRDVNR
jgi:phosphoribosylanthranilate isomerase